MAFVFLNRYLDLTEAMEDADGSAIENADFVQTDIPFDFHLPEKHYLSEARREEVAGLQWLQRTVPVPGAASSCGGLWLRTGGGHCVDGRQLCCAQTQKIELAQQLSNTSCSSCQLTDQGIRHTAQTDAPPSSCAAQSLHGDSAPVTMWAGLSEDTAWTAGALIASTDHLHAAQGTCCGHTGLAPGCVGAGQPPAVAPGTWPRVRPLCVHLVPQMPGGLPCHCCRPQLCAAGASSPQRVCGQSPLYTADAAYTASLQLSVGSTSHPLTVWRQCLLPAAGERTGRCW